MKPVLKAIVASIAALAFLAIGAGFGALIIFNFGA